MDTVVACSTPFGSSALSVVRISGPKTKSFIDSLQKKTRKIKHNTPFLSSFLDKDGVVFDEGIINVFFGPNSYTGEDLAEVSCHGNPIIVDQIISLACDFGCRTADPGEFTKKAYLSGKLDIAQAESVASLIASRSLEGTKITYKNLGGELSANISSSKDVLISVVGEIEFNLDISEEGLQPNLFKKSFKKISLLKNKMEDALSGFNKTRESRLFKSNFEYLIKSFFVILKSITLYRRKLLFKILLVLSIPGFLLFSRFFITYFSQGYNAGNLQSLIVGTFYLVILFLIYILIFQYISYVKMNTKLMQIEYKAKHKKY